MPRVLSVLTLALTLVTLGWLPATATVKSSNVSCGNNACSEIWQFTCLNSKIVLGRVRDTVGADDTLLLTMVGSAPTIFKGTGETSRAFTPGSFSDGAVVGNFFTNQAFTISGFAVVTNLSNTDSSYDLDIFCEERDGPTHDPKVFKRVQDD